VGGSTATVLLMALSVGIPSSPAASPHVRSTDARILQRLHEGRSRSATFKGLVDQLEGTNTIVYVERGICAFGHVKACLPHSITVVGDIRFLRIIVDAGQDGAQELALIGHELQHALEIARAPNIRSADDITGLFRRIGRSPHCPQGTPECYETSAALAAGDAVLREVLAREIALGCRGSLRVFRHGEQPSKQYMCAGAERVFDD
jgi:hypothetical protein